jgi:8-oxo-dGTP pyrophosphatase MutT (NUDIX family)
LGSKTLTNIKVKSICIFENDNKILVSKSFDSVQKDYYYRPIGGTTEFGEYTKETLVREIQEELNAQIKNITLEQVIENIFTCDGLKGHEIVFLYKADFIDKFFYELKEYEIIEGEEIIKAYWININDFVNKEYRLVPHMLIEYYSKKLQNS